jgi:PAS domain-containing protein
MLVYSIALELTMLFGLWLALAVSQRDRSTPGRFTFTTLCLAAMVWCLGNILQARGLAPETVTDRIRMVGMLTCGPLWLGTAAHASHNELARRVPWFPLILLVPCGSLYGLMYSERWGSLFLVTVEDGPDHIGPLLWVLLAYTYTLVALGCVLLIRSAFRMRGHRPWGRRLAVGITPIFPLLGNVLHLMSDRTHDVELTPIFFIFAMIAVRGELLTGTLFQVLPVSQHDLMRQLPIAVVLTDRAGVVIDVNPAAEKRLGVIEALAIGRNLDAVLREAGADTRVEISPILSGGIEAGQMVLIDPPRKDARP